MKLIDIVLLVVAFAFFVIGTHQAIIIGIKESYWIFMFSLLLLFLYGYRKNQNSDNKDTNDQKSKGVKKNKRKNG